jgi:hypothetical protein
MAWLTDVLERIVSGRTKVNELHTLLPCWDGPTASNVPISGRTTNPVKGPSSGI